MQFDNHIHTEISADSEMIAEEALRQAEQRGVGLVFTEHFDFGYPYDDLDFTFSPEEYWKKYEPLRGERLRLGVEVGMTKEAREENAKFLKRAPFDLVIGSIHLVEGKDIYYPEFYEGRPKEETYRAYFAAMAEEAAAEDMDVLGHIDYIARKAPYENPELDYGSFRQEIDRVLKVVTERGIVLELNTRRLGSRQAMKELVPIYRKYHEMGGRYVTIGSDSHDSAAVAMYFKEALEFAEALELEPVTFCGRKMQRIGGR